MILETASTAKEDGPKAPMESLKLVSIAFCYCVSEIYASYLHCLLWISKLNLLWSLMHEAMTALTRIIAHQEQQNPNRSLLPSLFSTNARRVIDSCLICRKGVLTNACCPGWCRTDMVAPSSQHSVLTLGHYCYYTNYSFLCCGRNKGRTTRSPLRYLNFSLQRINLWLLKTNRCCFI